MINQQKISSGFDVEFLMGEEYIKYFLLCSMETGSIPWYSVSEVKDEFGNHLRDDATVTHPPEILNTKRLYPVHPDFIGNEHPYLSLGVPAYSSQEDEFTVTFLQESTVGADIRVKLYPTILTDVDHPALTKIQISNLLFINLDIKLSLVSTTDTNGNLSDIGLKIELLDINGDLINAAESLPPDEDGNPVFSKADTLAKMKEQFDRTVDFSVAGGGKIARIEMKKFFADDETNNAIGVYINLILQNGPNATDLLEASRGDIDAAQNFMPKTSHMAFGFAEETFKRLSDDIFQKMAVLKEGSTTEFEYPMKQDDKPVGKFKSVSIRPETITGGGSSATFTNVLIIDIHGEYFIDNFFDPDFHVLVKLVPIQSNGLLDFDIEVDFNMSPLGQFIIYFVETLITFVVPKLGLSLLFSTIIIVRLIEKAGKDYAGSFVEDEMAKSSFLDTIPHKLTIEKRRWDPLYTTTHRVESAINDLVVNNNGFAFSANDVFIGKKFEPLNNMVIRAATRNEEGAVNGLLYRANDIQPYLTNDLTFIFPATDRMPFVEILDPIGDIESYRVSLTLEQIKDRLASENKGVKDKHLEKILYEPKKVHVIEHQVYKILAISETELPEIKERSRQLLRSELRAQNSAAYRQQAISELQAELGRDPTEAEISIRFNSILTGAVNNALEGRYNIELDRRMKFDLEPFEFADLQKRKFLILGLNHLVIRTLHRHGKVTVYYRDYEQPFEPNVNTWDNLLSLPRYVSS